MQVKDLSASGAKFKTRAANAAPDYVKGATAAGGRWKAGVDSSADRWAAGVQDAVARQAFSKGVSKTGADYYTSRVAKLGQQRYAQGVAEGADNWTEGFKPFADALNSVTLSPRGIKGSASNQQRSVEVQIALRNKKTGAA
jgi:hypothetical protein